MRRLRGRRLQRGRRRRRRLNWKLCNPNRGHARRAGCRAAGCCQTGIFSSRCTLARPPPSRNDAHSKARSSAASTLSPRCTRPSSWCWTRTVDALTSSIPPLGSKGLRRVDGTTDAHLDTQPGACDHGGARRVPPREGIKSRNVNRLILDTMPLAID